MQNHGIQVFRDPPIQQPLRIEMDADSADQLFQYLNHECNGPLAQPSVIFALRRAMQPYFEKRS